MKKYFIKIIAFTLVAVMCFGLFACDKDDPGNGNNTNTPGGEINFNAGFDLSACVHEYDVKEGTYDLVKDGKSEYTIRGSGK